MSLPGIISLALQAIIYTNICSATSTATTTTTTTPTAISILFQKPPAANSTDDYILPISLGSNSQLLYLTPSTSSNDTFVNSPHACTPPGNNTAVDGCIKYRGGVFNPPASSTWKVGNSGFEWQSEVYELFAKGGVGADTLVLGALGKNVSVDGFTVGVVDGCNMTSGFLGLGRSSTLLDKLVQNGVVESHSYGLHVGVDIQDHAFPVVDPTFDDGGGRMYNSDYSSGVGKRDENGTAVHSFPGSLTLGGYDKSRIDNRTATLKAPIASDGSLQLEVTNMVLLNNVVHDLLNTTRKVVIDSSTPYMYLPESLAQQLSYAIEAQDGEPGVDFFYGASADKFLGNITFTLQKPGGGASTDIVIPPSVLYQPITALRDYIPVGNANYNHYLPVKTFKDSSDQPIVLGRTFLKAAYIFVNYDKKSFELSQVAYNRGPPNLVTVTSTGLTIDDNAIAPISTSVPTPASPPPHPLIVPIAAAVGGGAVVFAFFAVAFLLWRRRASQSALAPIPSTVTVNHYGNEDGNGTPMVNLPPRDIKNPNGPGGEQDWGVWEKDGSGGYYTPHPLEAGGMQYHEMESDYVGMATSPSQGHPPVWAELPAEPQSAHMHPAFAGQRQSVGPVPEVRYEMM